MKSTVLTSERSIEARKPVKRRARRLGLQIDREVVADILRVVEGPLLGFRLDEEVERVVDRHVGDEIDLDLQLADRLGEDEAGKVVAVGVLLQVHEMAGGADLERMAEHAGARMRRRLQADRLRPQRNRAVVACSGSGDRQRL